MAEEIRSLRQELDELKKKILKERESDIGYRKKYAA